MNHQETPMERESMKAYREGRSQPLKDVIEELRVKAEKQQHYYHPVVKAPEA